MKQHEIMEMTRVCPGACEIGFRWWHRMPKNATEVLKDRLGNDCKGFHIDLVLRKLLHNIPKNYMLINLIVRAAIKAGENTEFVKGLIEKYSLANQPILWSEDVLTRRFGG